MKKIVLSVATIAIVAAVAIGATTAYFSDTETSTGNTFTAGSIDLKIDFDGYYNKPADGNPNAGSWDEKDLEEGVDKFFDFEDLKPGDYGEGTISLHVYSNDAWGRMILTDVKDTGNTCVDPETEESSDADCYGQTVGATEPDGELRENLIFYGWLDEGITPGFQGKDRDQGEGDNIWQDNEPIMIEPGTIDEAGETHEFWDALALYRASIESLCTDTDPDGDGQTGDPYGACQGIARDGRLVGSTTYYLGLAWDVPYTTGNEAQTDSLSATVKFEAVQHRNNPGQVF